MITAVYVVSPKDYDKLGQTIQSVRRRKYDGRDVYVLPSSHEGSKICSVVYFDDLLLKTMKKIEKDEDVKEVLTDFQKRIDVVLVGEKAEADDVRVFVHLGSQYPTQCDEFSRRVARVQLPRGAFNCQAISFGHHYPSWLFKDGVFSPPDDEGAFHQGVGDDFKHFRALRILLESCRPNEGGECLFPRCRPHSFSQEEKEYIAGNECIKKVCGEKVCGDWSFRSRVILSTEEWKGLKQKLSEIGG